MFAIAGTPIDVATLRRSLDAPAAGAIVCFEGVVRDHQDGRSVHRLAYQAFETLATREGQTIIDEAHARFDLLALRCVHRVGLLDIGDVAVWVGVAAAHRDAAFLACRYVIDEVKRRVPIWKQEHYADGASEWLHPDGTA
jgi:molybdopterin synthase catalytic subunit